MNAKDFLDRYAQVIEGKCHNLGRVASLTVEFSNPRFYVNGCKWWGVVIYEDPEMTRTECYNVFYGFVKYCGISVDDIYKWVLDNFAIMFKDHPYIHGEEMDSPSL